MTDQPDERLRRIVMEVGIAYAQARRAKKRIKGALVSVYHIEDNVGTHRFLTTNDFLITSFGGVEEFERDLGRRYRTFELLGSTHGIQLRDRRKIELHESETKEVLKRIGETVVKHSNAVELPEAWMPEKKEEPTSVVNAYHVEDTNGRHYFLNVSELRLGVLDLTVEQFEAILSQYYPRYELLGKCTISHPGNGEPIAQENPALRIRIEQLEARYPEISGELWEEPPILAGAVRCENTMSLEKEKLVCMVCVDDAISEIMQGTYVEGYLVGFILRDRESGKLRALYRFKSIVHQARHWFEYVPSVQDKDTECLLRDKLEKGFQKFVASFAKGRPFAVACHYPPDDGGHPWKTLDWLVQNNLAVRRPAQDTPDDRPRLVSKQKTIHLMNVETGEVEEWSLEELAESAGIKGDELKRFLADPTGWIETHLPYMGRVQ